MSEISSPETISDLRLRRLSKERLIKVAGASIVGGGIALVALFLPSGLESNPGHDPDVIVPCTDDELEGQPVTFEQSWDDPKALLRRRWTAGVKVNDMSNKSGRFRVNHDKVDGLGELVCSVGEVENTRLIFLPSAEEMRTDWIEDHLAEQKKLEPQRLVEDARTQAEQAQ